jgi:hypothetical protein
MNQYDEELWVFIKLMNYFRRRTLMDKLFASPKETGFLFGIPPGTLANWRCQRQGPKFYKFGRRILYFISDVENWVKQNPILKKGNVKEKRSFSQSGGCKC